MKICKINHREVAYAQPDCPACVALDEPRMPKIPWKSCPNGHVNFQFLQDRCPLCMANIDTRRLESDNEMLRAEIRACASRASEDTKENEKLAAKIRVQEGNIKSLDEQLDSFVTVNGYLRGELNKFKAANQELLDELNARKDRGCQRYDHSECTHKGTGATICRNQHGPIHFYTRNCPICDLVGQNKFIRADWDKTNALQQEELEFLRANLESSRKLAAALSAKAYRGPCPRHYFVPVGGQFPCTCDWREK